MNVLQIVNQRLMLFTLLLLEVFVPLFLKLRFQQATLHAPLRRHLTLTILLEIRGVEDPERLKGSVFWSSLRTYHQRDGREGAVKAYAVWSWNKMYWAVGARSHRPVAP